ncbi:hypothetical protein DFP72DRAFT_641452 [Ephemerocybe angulata]|uniref:Oxidoreductase-like domain-containing protein n=1 Tax=Ephemerocybe angulata TaxID=980116 RepID=A0A8H6HGL8_9AGAR|nr:hypothetical protein DFP72DRAFT_641452 [Tulosesus angulatus]
MDALQTLLASPKPGPKPFSTDTPTTPHSLGTAHSLTRHRKNLPATANAPGRNLSARWEQREKSLRKKEELVKEKEELEEEGVTEGATSESVGAILSAPGAETFRGFVIPQEPQPPADDECCMSGCAICVYDLYDDSMQSYEDSVSAVQSNLRALGVLEAEWPDSIRPKGSADADGKDGAATAGGAGGRGQVLSAFEELERSLKAKQTAG